MLNILLSDCALIQWRTGNYGLDGIWSGITSYGDQVTFEVEDNRITKYELGIKFLGCRVTGIGDFNPDINNDLYRIVNDKFKITMNVNDENILGVKSSYVFEGTFLSDRSALGTFRFKMTPNCQVLVDSNITWSAENQK